MESFFSSLKAERIARKTYRTRNKAKAEVFDYIEPVGNIPPAEAEERYYAMSGTSAIAA